MGRKKYPMTEVMVRQAAGQEPAYVAYHDPASRTEAMKALSAASQETVGIMHHTSAYSRDFSNLTTNVSGRPGLTRSDYDHFRPDEAVPTRHRDILDRCDLAYSNNGLIKNIIDLMGDFGCQGIRIVCKDKKKQRFYQNWFKKVNGQHVSERFLNNLYRLANVVIRKQTAKISKQVEERMYKTHASPDEFVTLPDAYKSERREIPWRYTFLNPSTVEVIGGSLASFTGKPAYALCVPTKLARIINSPKSDAEKAMVAKLPADIIAAAKTRKPYPLPQDKTIVVHYKKDDWREWATPMIHAIMDNIITLEKLQLADNAALDGAISNIRIFTLGSLEHEIMPTPAAILAFSEILQNHPGVGTMDLVCGPDVKLIESNTNVHQFLGQAKYEPTLNAIYTGMGIPPTLTGAFGASGTTNNFIALKTLTERLQYGRDLLIKFWERELAELQRAMDWRTPASIEFDLMTLVDEVAMKSLYKDLADRQIVSDELIQHMIGADPDMERIRLTRESKARENGTMVEKAGPFHDPQVGDGLKNAAMQLGLAAPSEVGVQLQPRKPGEKSLMDHQNEQLDKTNKAKLEQAKAKPKPKGQPGQGRPKNKKDSTKRKTKTFSPRTKAMEIWATDIQESIATILNPAILARYQKKNMRSLTAEEAEMAEKLKFGVLSNLEPLVDVDEAVIAKCLEKSPCPKMMAMAEEYILSTAKSVKRKLTVGEIKNIQASVYVINKEIE